MLSLLLWDVLELPVIWYILFLSNKLGHSLENGNRHPWHLKKKSKFWGPFWSYSRVQKSIENWSVSSKVALGEVGMPLPWWCAALVLLAPDYWSLFLNFKKLFIMEKWPEVIWNSEISAILPCEIQSFNFDLWKNDQRSFVHYKQIF